MAYSLFQLACAICVQAAANAGTGMAQHPRCTDCRVLVAGGHADAKLYDGRCYHCDHISRQPKVPTLKEQEARTRRRRALMLNLQNQGWSVESIGRTYGIGYRQASQCIAKAKAEAAACA